MMRWLRGIGALLAMVVVLIGAPVLLVSWGRLGVTDWWTRADDGSLLLAVLTIAGWLAWGAFVLAAGLEVVRVLSGHRYVVNLPLLGGLQAICATLVLAVVALAASSGPSQQAGAGEPPLQVSDDQRSIRVESPPAPSAAPTVTSGPAVPPATAPTASSGSGSEDGYLVAPGDDLWSLADRLLGDGTRWRDLVAANPETLTDPTDALTPGTRLRLPADALAAVQPERIAVVRGDTLSGLAEEHLGKASRWPQLARANAGLIEDPDHIEVGWELTLPAKAVAAASHPEPTDSEPAPATPADGMASEVDAGAGPQAEEGDTTEPVEGPASTTVPPDGEFSSVPLESGTAPEPTVPGTEPVDPDNRTSTTPAEQAGTHTRTEHTATPEPTPAVDDRSSPDAALIGSVGALAAAGLVGGWEARRLLQNRTRAPGRRVLHPEADLARFHSALGRRQHLDHTHALTSALRAIGRHHHETGQPLPPLAEVLTTAEWLEFRWAEPAGKPPLGFSGDARQWRVQLGTGEAPPFADDDSPCAYPALVSLGTDAAGTTVMVDVERSRVLGVVAETRELQLSSLASMAVELACAPWAAEASLTVVGPEAGFAAAAGGEAVTHLPDVTTALVALRRRHAARTRALAGEDLRRLRVDPDRAEAVAPEVFVFHDPLDPGTQRELDDLLSGAPVGICVVLAATSEAPADWQLFGDLLHPSGRFAGSRELLAHAIPGATRDAVESLYRIADSARTDSAPWWSDASSNVHLLRPRETPSEDPVDIVQLRRVVRPHPVLLLIGPVDLTGPTGPEPSRSRSPLIEMCSWILEYPGRTATQMAAGLGIAESTRRSNMSRLRTWLGCDEDGEAYLPDAYSGRIRLHPEVTSDAGRLQLLTGPGVNRLGENTLIAALDLVRGGILADAAPGQWFWAEELRSDLAATLRDTGLVLVDRALTRGDVDLARWAAERALVVAPEDELLLCARIRTEHAAGNRAVVQRLVARLSQQARELGVDLLPETVMLCQQVIEGRGRLRRA